LDERTSISLTPPRLRFGEKEAFILTFAEDVYRVREAKNGGGVVIRTINMKNRNDMGYLQAL